MRKLCFVFPFLLSLMLFPLPVRAQESADVSGPPPGASYDPIPLSDKFYSTKYVQSWAMINGLAAMGFTFVNLEERLEGNRKIFTQSGYDRFVSDLEESGMLDLIRTSRVVLQVGMVKNPEMIDEGIVDGRYRWVVQIPIYIRFSNKKTRFTDYMMLTLVVVRSNELQIRDAIAIEEWVTELMPDPYARERESSKNVP